MLAYVGLGVEKALQITVRKQWWGPLPEVVTVSPIHYQRDPPIEEVMVAERKITWNNPHLEDLRFWLAQRLYLVHFLDKRINIY